MNDRERNERDKFLAGFADTLATLVRANVIKRSDDETEILKRFSELVAIVQAAQKSAMEREECKL